MSAAVAQLRAWSDELMLRNFETLARLPPDGREPVPPRQFGGVVAFATGRRLGYFNSLIVLGPATAADITEGAGWLREQGAGFSVRLNRDVENDEVRATLVGLGLAREPDEPGMVLHPLSSPPAPPADLTIETMRPETMDRWYEAAALAWGLEATAAVGRLSDSIPPYAAADPGIRVFAGYVDRKPVATSLAVETPNVVGIYAVATAEGARGRGYGSAMTWAAIDAGREWGCKAAALQASPMGEPVYRRMGFQAVTRYATWESREVVAEDAPRGW